MRATIFLKGCLKTPYVGKADIRKSLSCNLTVLLDGDLKSCYSIPTTNSRLTYTCPSDRINQLESWAEWGD